MLATVQLATVQIVLAVALVSAALPSGAAARVAEINAARSVTPDLRYSYGIAGAPNNAAGRVTLVEDEAGSASREYGACTAPAR